MASLSLRLRNISGLLCSNLQIIRRGSYQLGHDKRRRAVVVCRGRMFNSVAVDKQKVSQSSVRKKSRIFTLQPHRMVAAGQEVFDLSNKGLQRFFFGRLADKPTPMGYLSFHSSRIPFPPGSKGTFYYYHAPGRPALSGELRFRVCDSVSQFNEGVDLVARDDVTWSIPLCRLVQSESLQEIVAFLIQEGLVDTALVNDIRKLPLFNCQRTSLTLYDLHEPFIMDLTQHTWPVWVVTRQMLHKHRLQHFFEDMRKPFFQPYTGALRLRFEMSTLPQHIHNPAVVLRVLEEITPVKCIVPDYDGYVLFPRPGELFSRRGRSPKGSKYVPWSYPLDTKKDDAFSALANLASSESQ